MTVKQLLQAHPSLDAEVVLSHVLGVDRSHLFAHPETTPTAEQVQRFSQLMGRREQGEPLAYLIGTQPFYGRLFFVTRDTLIPRPETETLIDLVKEDFDANERIQLVDVGTGSGCIALTLALEFPQAQIMGLDISETALAVAEKNRAHLGIINAAFKLGNLLGDAQADAIIANLPYLAEHDFDQSPTHHELTFEPYQALVAKDDGLALIKELIEQAADGLKSGGKLYLELLPRQIPPLAKWAKASHPFSVVAKPDITGTRRFIVLTKT